MDTYYLVMGGHGEYSDRDEWPVAVYAIGSAAVEHVGLLTRCVRKFKEAGSEDLMWQFHRLDSGSTAPKTVERLLRWMSFAGEPSYWVTPVRHEQRPPEETV